MSEYFTLRNAATVGVVVFGAWIVFSRKKKAIGDASGLPQVSFGTKVQIIIALIRFRISWGKHDCKLHPKHAIAGQAAAGELSSIFKPAAECVVDVADGACVYSSGFPNSERCSIFYWAVKENYLQKKSPKGITWISVGAHGARGKAPGSIEELGLAPGILKRYISGHLETVKSILRLAAKNEIELYNLPQGTLAKLIKEQGETGNTYLESQVGVGTFFDPRVGTGGRLTDRTKEDLITVTKKGLLRYEIPKLDIVFFHARYADTEGNVYLDRNTTLTETVHAVAAVKRNGGKAFASVNFVYSSSDRPDAKTREKLASEGLLVRREQLDGVTVFNVGASKDTFGIRDDFTTKNAGGWDRMVRAFQFTRLVNKILKITPTRTETEMMLGRMAAARFVESFKGMTRDDAIGCIGVGLPEEAGQYLVAQRIAPSKVTICTETGTMGGLPGAGIFFGTAIHPEKLITSGDMFRMWEKKLHTAILGAAEVDRYGNVNVSRRGPSVMDVVGAGGFTNIVCSAKNIIFVCKFATGKGAVKFNKAQGRATLNHATAKPKFVEKVREITFCGSEACDRGVNVVYCTDVGVFKLAKSAIQGTHLELVSYLDGIDIDRDIVKFTGIGIVVSSDVKHEAASVVTGAGFHLEL